MERVFNFNPGPAALPLEVLEQVQKELLNCQNTGMSILEMSHRDPVYEKINKEAAQDIKDLLGLDDEWCVSLEAVSYSADRYELGDTEIPGLNNLKKAADFDKFSETHSDISKFKYNQAMKKALSDLLIEEIVPLRDDNYRIDDTKLQ